MMKRLGCAVGILWALGILVAGFLAYFVIHRDPVSGLDYDGLGRQLVHSPWLMRFIFGQERLWAGWGWFAVDMAVFWAPIVGVGMVAQLREDRPKSTREKEEREDV